MHSCMKKSISYYFCSFYWKYLKMYFMFLVFEARLQCCKFYFPATIHIRSIRELHRIDEIEIKLSELKICNSYISFRIFWRHGRIIFQKNSRYISKMKLMEVFWNDTIEMVMNHLLIGNLQIIIHRTFWCFISYCILKRTFTYLISIRKIIFLRDSST